MDLINRESILEYRYIPEKGFEDDKFTKGWNSAIKRIYDTAKTVNNDSKPIKYQDCADAMLKMWMEEVLTDGEYNRIMNKLNKKHKDGDFN